MVELVRLASRRLGAAPLGAIAAALEREGHGVPIVADGAPDAPPAAPTDAPPDAPRAYVVPPFAPRDPDRAWALDVALERAASTERLTLIVDLDAARTEDARFVDPPRGASPLAVARAAILRHQRLVARPATDGHRAALTAILARHDALYEAADLTRPLVRADRAHARDAWRWLLRLDGAAGLAPQIAALFHDVERLESEADRRRDHLHGGDYQAYKDAHARAGAAITARALAGLVGLDLDGDTLAAALRLIAAHERTTPRAGDAAPPDREALTLVNDADALSFFSLNASGFLDYFGPSHTRSKIAWTLARMSPRARRWLPVIALRPDVATLVAEALTALVCAPSERLPR
jgi:hypothetical protein